MWRSLYSKSPPVLYLTDVDTHFLQIGGHVTIAVRSPLVSEPATCFWSVFDGRDQR